MVAKYYGISPSEMDEMPMEVFIDYINGMVEIEQIFKGGRPNFDSDVADEAESDGGATVREILILHGITPPEQT